MKTNKIVALEKLYQMKEKYIIFIDIAA